MSNKEFLKEVQEEAQEVEAQESEEVTESEPESDDDEESDGENAEQDTESEDDSEEDAPFFGEKPPEQAKQEVKPNLVNELRRQLREKERKIKELSNKQVQEPVVTQLRPKPTRIDHNFDDDAFEADLLAWSKEKEVYENESQKQVQAQQEIERDFVSRVQNFEEQSKKVKISGFDDLKAEVESKLNRDQQATIFYAVKDPVRFVAAIGANPEKLAELQKIKNPIVLAVAMRDLEASMTIQKRKVTTKPEKVLSGGASPKDNERILNNLREEADKTGDRSKVVAHLRKMKLNRG